MDDSDRLGIVSYSDEAKIDYNLEYMTNENKLKAL